MPLKEGDKLGPYRIMEQLGQGGMATVYRAYHASLDRFVAIKILHPSLKDDDTFYVRFQREAQIVAKLEHPHIVPIYDFSAQDDEPYLVMKFVEGETLKSRAKRQPLQISETLRILKAMASALDYAHRRDVLHRDVKPSNIILDKEGVPFLTDFGLARMATAGESSLSQDVLLGTPNYISPEQGRGEKNLTSAADIYSLGVVLYELVVGRVPFSADTPYAVVHDHIYKPVPPPSQVNPSIPRPVESVILRALAKKETERYPTATAMMEAFEFAAKEVNLAEMTATNIRLDKFVETQSKGETPATMAMSPSPQDIDNLIRAAVAEAVSAVSNNPTPATPTLTPAQQRQKDQQERREAWQKQQLERQRVRRMRAKARNTWCLLGVFSLVAIFIAVLAVTQQALENEVVQRNPSLDEPEETLAFTPPPSTENPPREGHNAPPPPTPQTLQTDLSVREAQALIEAQPEDPAAHLSLALAYFRENKRLDAQASLIRAVVELDAPPELVQQVCDIVLEAGDPMTALEIWMLAYGNAPLDKRVQAAAGENMYLIITNAPREAINLRWDAEMLASPLGKIMQAQVLISHSILPTRLAPARRALEEVLAQDLLVHEAYLVLGNYHQKAGNPDEARAAWQSANDPAAPDWVRREAQTLLDQG